MAEAPTPAEKKNTRRHVQEMLRQEDARSFRGTLGNMVKGIGWCLVAGILVATLIYFGFNALFGTPVLPWTVWLGVFLLVLTVFLIVRGVKESRKPDYVVRSLTDDDAPGDAVVDVEATNPLYAQLLFWAPRAILDGFAALRGRPPEQKTLLYKRMARIVVELARWTGGVPIKALIRPPENMPIFAASLDWLDRHDYTGKSKDGERIWLTSIGKKKLADRGIVVKVTEVSD